MARWKRRASFLWRNFAGWSVVVASTGLTGLKANRGAPSGGLSSRGAYQWDCSYTGTGRGRSSSLEIGLSAVRGNYMKCKSGSERMTP